MKHQVGIALLSLCVYGAITPANGITIVSSDLDISGSWTETWFTSADRQTHSVSGTFGSSGISPHGWGFASGGIDSFNLSLSAQSAPGTMTTAWGIAALPGTRIDISANATTLFHPDSTQLSVNLTGAAQWNYRGNEQDMQVTIKDITASTLLLDIAHLDEIYPSFDSTYAFNVDPSHLYELTLSGFIHSFSDKNADMFSRVNLVDSTPGPNPLPDSGVSCILLLLSLGTLFCARNKLVAAR